MALANKRKSYKQEVTDIISFVHNYGVAWIHSDPSERLKVFIAPYTFPDSLLASHDLAYFSLDQKKAANVSEGTFALAN